MKRLMIGIMPRGLKLYRSGCGWLRPLGYFALKEFQRLFLAGSIFLMLFAVAGYCEVPIIADEQRAEFNASTVQEAHPAKVLSQEGAQLLANTALKERNIDAAKYDMLSIEELQWSDTKAWLIVFQLKKELRRNPKKTGGEIFVNIDQNTSEVMVTYAGSADSYKG